MGAYYNPAVQLEDEKFLDNYIRFSPYPFNNGQKLAEHGYLLNKFVNSILNTIPLDTKFKMIWLCDYCEDKELNWDNIEEIEFTKTEVRRMKKRPQKTFIVNLDKKEYIDIEQLLKTNKKKPFDGWLFHPIVLLTNSETEAAGGGDISDDYLATDEMGEYCRKHRGSWKGDTLVRTMHPVSIDMEYKDFKDITDEVVFLEKSFG